jgi:hypothetical protein
MERFNPDVKSEIFSELLVTLREALSLKELLKTLHRRGSFFWLLRRRRRG